MTDLFDRAAMQALGSPSTLRARSRSRFESGPALHGEPGPAEAVFTEGDPLAEGAVAADEPAPSGPVRHAARPVQEGLTARPRGLPEPAHETAEAPDLDSSAHPPKPEPPSRVRTPERLTAETSPAPASWPGRAATIEAPRASSAPEDGDRAEASVAIPAVGARGAEPSPARGEAHRPLLAAANAPTPARRAARPPEPSAAPVAVDGARGGDLSVGATVAFATAEPERRSPVSRHDETGPPSAIPRDRSGAQSDSVEAGGAAPFEDPLGVGTRARMERLRADAAGQSPMSAAAVPPAAPATLPPIEITIGRMEIRAAATPPAPRAPKTFGPHVDLADYRSRRDRKP